MAQGFIRDGDQVLTSLETVELNMVRQLLDEMCDLLAGEADVAAADLDPLAAQLGLQDLSGDDVATPDDPVLARLLPDGYRDNPDSAAEFRRLTDGSLRRAKIVDAEIMRMGLDRAEVDPEGTVTLAPDQAVAWLRAINDLRLALGVRLNITTDSQFDVAMIPHDDPRAVLVALYDFLTWWQDSLLGAMMDSP